MCSPGAGGLPCAGGSSHVQRRQSRPIEENLTQQTLQLNGGEEKQGQVKQRPAAMATCHDLFDITRSHHTNTEAEIKCAAGIWKMLSMAPMAHGLTVSGTTVGASMKAGIPAEPTVGGKPPGEV